MKEGAAKEHTNKVGHGGKSSGSEDGHACQLSPTSYIFLMEMQNSFVHGGQESAASAHLIYK